MRIITKRFLLSLCLLLSSAILFAQSWNTETSIPTGRSGSSAVTLNGKIYVIGGSNAAGAPLNSVDVYNPIKKTWSTAPNMLTPRSEFYACVSQGKIYVFGGRTLISGIPVPTANAEQYDPLVGAWVAIPTMNFSRTQIFGGLINDTVYIAGGQPGNITTLEAFSTLTNSWSSSTTYASMPVGKSGVNQGATIGSALHCIGGAISNAPQATNMRYDVGSNTWAPFALLPFFSFGGTATNFGNQIYYCGGNNSATSITSEHYFYDHTLFAWTQLQNMPSARTLHSASKFCNQYYVFSGLDSLGLLSNKVYAYNLLDSLKFEAKFGYTTNACNAVQFLDSSFSSCSSITGRIWDFGDGGTSTLTNPKHNFLTAGTFNVQLIITDNYLNKDSFVLPITITTIGANANAGPDTTVCPNVPYSMLGSGGSTYTWFGNTTGLSSTNISNPTATINTNTTFTLKVDSNGCSDTDQVDINIYTDSLNITGPFRVCYGDSATLNSSGGVSNFAWTPSLGLGSTNTATTKAAPPTNTTYLLTALSSHGCVVSDSFRVRYFPRPKFSFDTTLTTCGLYSFQTVDTPVQGLGFVTWSWNFGDGGTANGKNTSHYYASTGTYTVTLTANYGFNCSISYSKNIFVNKDVAATISNDTTICPGSTVILKGTGSGLTYNWIINYAGLNGLNSDTTIATPLSTTTYYLEVTNSSGCKDTLDVDVTVFDDQFTISGDSILCIGDVTTLTLDKTNFTNINWEPATVVTSQGLLTTDAFPTSPTYIKASGVSSNGCSIVDSILVEVSEFPNFYIDAMPTPICKNQPVTITAHGGTQYSWSPATGLNRTTSSSVIFNYDKPITYTVEISGSCYDSIMTYTPFIENQFIYTKAYSPDSLINCLAAKATLIAEGGVQYSWTPSHLVSNPTAAQTKALPTIGGTYYCEIIDQVGCITHDTVVVKLENGMSRFIMPNAFSPTGNNAETNEFKILDNHNFDLISFEIYNRWGTKIFETSDIKKGWNGKFKTEVLPMDNYIWKVRGNTPCGEFIETGTVLLTN